MVFVTQHLQLVEGLSPLEAGLWLLPGVAATAVGFLASPLLARRVRPAYLIGAGLLVSVAGMVSLTRVDATSGLVALVTGFAVSNLGAGPMVTLGTDLVVGSAPVERAGSAGAINETSGEFGFALGIALFGSVGAAVYRAQFTIPSGVPDPAGRVARESAAGAVSVADRLPEPLGAAVLDVAHQAYTSALHTVAAVAALLLLAVAISVAILLRHVRPSGTAGTTGAAAATGVAGPADASEADPAAVSA
jgi:DHA2 family multidrug resistance protein-like MFS transporter